MGEALKNMIKELVNEVSDEDLLDLVYKLLLSNPGALFLCFF